MAHIHVLVYSSIATNTTRIWARNEDNGRVCYGALLGTPRELKVEDSKVSTLAKVKRGYVTVLTIIDKSSGIIGDAAMKGVVSGVCRALTGDEEEMERDSVEARVARHLAQNNVNEECLAWLGARATFTVSESLVTIRDLSAFNDDTLPASTPVH